MDVFHSAGSCLNYGKDATFCSVYGPWQKTIEPVFLEISRRVESCPLSIISQIAWSVVPVNCHTPVQEVWLSI